MSAGGRKKDYVSQNVTLTDDDKAPLSIHLSISISYVFVYYLSLYYYYSPFNIILCQYNMYFLQNMPILSFCQFLPVSAG